MVVFNMNYYDIFECDTRNSIGFSVSLFVSGCGGWWRRNRQRGGPLTGSLRAACGWSTAGSHRCTGSFRRKIHRHLSADCGCSHRRHR